MSPVYLDNGIRSRLMSFRSGSFAFEAIRSVTWSMSGSLGDQTCRERRPRAGIERDPPQDAKDRRFPRNFNDLDLSSHLAPNLMPRPAIGLRGNSPLNISSDRPKALRPPV
jgi:hypothetical protein